MVTSSRCFANFVADYFKKNRPLTVEKSPLVSNLGGQRSSVGGRHKVYILVKSSGFYKQFQQTKE